jgi:hypothetical protein
MLELVYILSLECKFDLPRLLAPNLPLAPPKSKLGYLAKARQKSGVHGDQQDESDRPNTW